MTTPLLENEDFSVTSYCGSEQQQQRLSSCTRARVVMHAHGFGVNNAIDLSLEQAEQVVATLQKWISYQKSRN